MHARFQQGHRGRVILIFVFVLLLLCPGSSRAGVLVITPESSGYDTEYESNVPANGRPHRAPAAISVVFARSFAPFPMPA